MTVKELERLLKTLPKSMLVMLPLLDSDCVITISKQATRVVEIVADNKVQNALILEPERCNEEITEDQKGIAMTFMNKVNILKNGN